MAFQLALGCSGGVHRRCCSECTDNDSARVYLLASLGLSTITASGGPVVATNTTDFRTRTCAPFYPDGNSYNQFTPFDFSSSTSATIDTPVKSVGYFACPPLATVGQPPMGALEFLCTSGTVDARGFATVLSFTPGSCPNGFRYGDPYANFSAGVSFSCSSGVASYILSVRARFLLFHLNGTNAFALPGSSGTDWTRTSGSGPAGTYTKNGSTASNGANVIITVVSTGPLSGFTVYEMTATTWVSYPNTSVTMWAPNPAIDWNSLTSLGTATLS